MQLEVKVGKEIHKNQDNNLNNFIIKKEKGSDIKDIKNNNDKIDNNNIDNDKKSNDDYKFKRNLKNNTILSHFKITKKSNSSKMKYDDIINKLSRDSFSIYHDQSYHKLEKEQINEFKIKLLDWFDENKRKLPWRVNLENDTTDELKNLNAYKVWVSEIMLQQTQVETVKEYFIKWIKLFPTIESLALADIEKVNIAWAGLGYYQRAKRLHDGAKLVVDKFSGKIPNNLNDLLSLPGIGPYTAGAIASIAFGLPCETVDGNIMRVITRIYAISGDIRAQSTVTILWEKAKELLNKERPGDFNQAYMDFGSSVCTSTNPKCNICPFSGKDGNKPICKAYLESQIELPDLLDLEDLEKLYDIPSHRECNMCTEIPNGEKGIILFPVTRYPYKSPNKKKRDEECIVLVIKKIDKGNKSNFLMIKRPNKGNVFID
ncbi:DNA glycosylase [Neoconidiobolus thromboides FSU 785]|nr:DNA glycosylase [Neoconidiobolus thromboides FSU 785]